MLYPRRSTSLSAAAAESQQPVADDKERMAAEALARSKEAARAMMAAKKMGCVLSVLFGRFTFDSFCRGRCSLCIRGYPVGW